MPEAEGADHRNDDVEVLVVGAGPTGLMLANWLVKSGVRVGIIDGKDGPTVESRALGVHSRSMEIYDQLGVADLVLGQVVRVESMRQGFGRVAFAPVPLTDLGRGITPYPGMYVLEQSANERILADNLQALGGWVRWRHRLVDLHRSESAVRAVVESAEGLRTISARFAVGCDGASSAVRSLCGIPFEGRTSRQTFYLVDAVGVSGLAPASVNIRQGAAEFLLAFPMKPDDAGRSGQRLIGVASDDDVAAVTEEFARYRLAEAFGVTYEDYRWFSTYRLHYRIAARFRAGPIFLAGDAAHVHSPVGAQGMNTGLQDAHNLAFKLADVVAARASPASLDRYAAERRPVALHLLSTTDRLFRGVVSRSVVMTAVRRFAPRVALPIGVAVLPHLPIGRRLAGYLGQIRIRYPMDENARRGRRHPVVGRRLPWTGANFGVLRSARWQVHVYAADGGRIHEADGVARHLGLALHAFATTGRTALEPGTLYLVRPDGFVAAASLPEDAVDRFAALAGVAFAKDHQEGRRE
ncbi:FAD-dependent monooxygenase [Arthrobacter sp. NamB2]|uniref:FAD-dependent monooxygenase n=1 Tax=Arthrobacter sp. NamB2 TaxID=2576035 RepID=UPI001CB8A8BA|nr:FAD-dependent monooxygenase [Arthrobacter sp. NamB2]